MDDQILDKKAPSDKEERSEESKRVYLCDRCGSKMHERSCKIICPNCGNRFDCSDLNLYFDKQGRES